MTLLPATGSVVGGILKEKTARITDAMTDLQLATDGLRSRSSSACDQNDWRNSVAAFARTSSVFLRKTVLGDQNKRGTRLLDDRVLGLPGLRFDRLRKISSDKRRKIEVGFGLDGGIAQITKRDEQGSRDEFAEACVAQHVDRHWSGVWFSACRIDSGTGSS